MLVSLANFLRNVARFGTLFLSLCMISIAIFTGALNYGITIDTILRNLPNALPWFLLLSTLYLSWEYELLGGLIMLFLGFGALYYLNYNSHSTNTELFLIYGIILFALLFILSWMIKQIYSYTYN